MAPLPVEKIGVGGKDAAGNDIIYVYAKKPPTYAVYREPMKVAVHYADDPRREARQRAVLAALNPLRGQISGLIDGWRSDPREVESLEQQRGRDGFWSRLWARWKLSGIRRRGARAARYDRRVADAVVCGLEGSVPEALALLTEIRDGLIAERKSYAETDYLAWAAGFGLFVLALIWFMSSVRLIPNPPPGMHLIWTGAAAGVLGAFFSIATGLRNRGLLIDLQKWTNRRDAILRITVGTIGAGILLCLILAKMVTVNGITDALVGGSIVLAVVFGFVAGFSERAVGDLLARATGTIMDPKKEDVAAAQAKAAAQPGAAAAAGAVGALIPEQDELVPAAEQPELDVDACVSDSPLAQGEVLTKDEDLPVAVGGVSADTPPPAGGQPAAAAPVDVVKDLMEKGKIVPAPDASGGDAASPKADTPAE